MYQIQIQCRINPGTKGWAQGAETYDTFEGKSLTDTNIYFPHKRMIITKFNSTLQNCKKNCLTPFAITFLNINVNRYSGPFQIEPLLVNLFSWL